jgi:hypothetical protein
MSNQKSDIEIYWEGPALTKAEAYALAQLCKRIGFNDCEKLSVDKAEAYRMLNATDKVRSALESVGIWVR